MENKSILLVRLKSFLWRAGMMLLALTIDFAFNNLGFFNLSPQVTVVVGLVLGEISKQINNWLSKKE